eukprot:761181-Hanusia_phi.AAC.1
MATGRNARGGSCTADHLQSFAEDDMDMYLDVSQFNNSQEPPKEEPPPPLQEPDPLPQTDPDPIPETQPDPTPIQYYLPPEPYFEYNLSSTKKTDNKISDIYLELFTGKKL